MVDERIFLVIVPAVFFWCLMIPSHRRKFISFDRINVGRIVAFLAGSKTCDVDLRAFSFQLGDLSMILWYIVFNLSSLNYLVTNAYVLSIISGAITGLLLQKILKLFAR